MNYGMTFIVDLYDFEKDEELHVLTTPGDYIRMCEWADENIAGPQANETVASLWRNFATVWFALERRGKLEGLGLPGELDVQSLNDMADRFSIYVNELDDASLPLAKGRGK